MKLSQTNEVRAIHSWLRRHCGSPKFCQECGVKGEKKKGRWTIEYALIHGLEYERNPENYFTLCVRHHRGYDRESKMGDKHYLFGKHLSESTKKKIAATRKERGHKPVVYESTKRKNKRTARLRKRNKDGTFVSGKIT